MMKGQVRWRLCARAMAGEQGGDWRRHLWTSNLKASEVEPMAGHLPTARTGRRRKYHLTHRSGSIKTSLQRTQIPTWEPVLRASGRQITIVHHSRLIASNGTTDQDGCDPKLNLQHRDSFL